MVRTLVLYRDYFFFFLFVLPQDPSGNGSSEMSHLIFSFFFLSKVYAQNMQEAVLSSEIIILKEFKFMIKFFPLYNFYNAYVTFSCFIFLSKHWMFADLSL